jgi:uncharacterized protein (DUF983 family)
LAIREISAHWRYCLRIQSRKQSLSVIDKESFMAQCPQCQKEMSFLWYLAPGGKFKCNCCHKEHSKKVSGELKIVFSAIFFGLLAAFLSLAVQRSFFPSVYYATWQRLLFYWACGITGSLVTAKIVWRYFVKY